jgi:2-C-methyl-D-erythritol 4-phosphate cytidylyltransferase
LRTTAILVAAGPGTRLAAGAPKAFVPLRGIPLFVHALRAMTPPAVIAEAVVVVPRHQTDRALAFLGEHGPWRCPVSVVEGGAERQDSVRAGLASVEHTGLVAVHDGARPFLSAGVLEKVVAAATRGRAAIVAVPASDTVKQVHSEGWIELTPPRDRLWLAQTPQVFEVDLLRRAHAEAAAGGITATDDAVLVERLGVRVYVVAGQAANRKITTRDDLDWAEWVLSHRTAPR